MLIQKIFLAGNFISTQHELRVRNPYNGNVFATTFLAGDKELEEAIDGARRCRTEMAGLPSWKKSEALRFISDQVKRSRSELARVLCLESAKPLRYALGEIDRAAQTFLIASEECKRLPKEYISLDWTPPGENKEGLVKYFPGGIVAGIAPFNFPMNLAVHKIAPAIAAGCPIILKPASATPLSTLKLAEIIAGAGLPKGAVSILPMDRKTGNRLVTDERFSLLSFTGSPLVGWEMKKNAGRKKVVLELGGNAGVILSESAGLDAAIKKCLVSGFAYSGQICIHAQRIFVHASLYDAFIHQFAGQASRLAYGDPLDEATEISAMIDEDNAIRVEKWLSEAAGQGARIVCGGKRRSTYVEPTVITGTTTAMKVNAEEVFGPVVCVEKFNALEEAVRRVNDTRFGLQCGVFTSEIAEMDYCFNHLETGGVILNDVPTVRFDHMPYGGVKDSGLGREGVKYAIMDMMEPRILVK